MTHRAWYDDPFVKWLDRRFNRLERILITQQGDLMANLSTLTAEVEESTTVSASVAALVTGLAQQVRDNATDQVALEALATQLDNSNRVIQDAVTANTPVEPVPEPAPEQPPA